MEERFEIGDIVWTKVNKFPYWPSMVTYCPTSGTYVRLHKGKIHQYHVQYFGDTSHGWSSPSGKILHFEGKLKFIKKFNQELSKEEEKFHVPLRHQESWNLAVDEAESAIKSYPIKQHRFESLVFQYETAIKEDVTLRCPENGPSLSLLSTQKQKINWETCNNKCDVCRLGDVEMQCTGGCQRTFHQDCIGLTKHISNFKCAECIIDAKFCFVCKKDCDDIIKCHYNGCSKHYHECCMMEFDGANLKEQICSRHKCVTCFRENPSSLVCSKGELVQCLDCPSAFHDDCVPAGSKEYTDQTLQCPYHFVGKNKASSQPVINFNYCGICGNGGYLFLCDNCPNAVHQECSSETLESEEYLCKECRGKKYIYYHDLVWAKLGKHKWWPAQILHLSELPINIKGLEHANGEFAVKFFGTKDYAWLHRGRVFEYTEEDANATETKTSADKCSNYKLAIQEATAAYRLENEKNRFMRNYRGTYRPIRTNKVLHPAQIHTDNLSVYECKCHETTKDPCGPNSGCENRSLFIECSSHCKAEDACQNKRIQKRQYIKSSVFQTENRGMGLKTCQDVKQGDLISEYVGEIITPQEYKKRMEDLIKNRVTTVYFMQLNSKCVIDAGPMGNTSRFMNHSCEPNCQMMKWAVNGYDRAGIFALRDISSGEELTFDYRVGKSEYAQPCRCGSSKCRKVIGVVKLPEEKRGKEKSVQKKSTSLTNGINLNSKCLATKQSKVCSKKRNSLKKAEKKQHSSDSTNNCSSKRKLLSKSSMIFTRKRTELNCQKKKLSVYKARNSYTSRNSPPVTSDSMLATMQ